MNRCREEVVENLLGVCREPISRSQIVRQGNFSYMSLNPHLKLLVNDGLIKTLGGTYPILYKTTPKGLEMLERIRAYTNLLQPVD